MNRYLLVIGTDEFSGAGRVTKYFKNSLIKQKIPFLSYLFIGNINPKKSYEAKYFKVSKLKKFIIFLKIIFFLIKKEREIKGLYLQENAGLGKLYDIFFIFICKIYQKPFFYHNHSSGKYIKYDFLTKIIQIISHKKFTNIFLSKKEAQKFNNLYGKIGKYYFMSNSIFIDEIKNYKEKRPTLKKIKFGFLSNLTKEKGLDKFINIAKKAQNKNKKWEFFLAGPILFKKQYYLDQISKLSNLKYLGFVNNEKKKSLFYNQIHFFLFLSTYFHESEPLVILEAISHGSIPIVYDRGSISNLIASKELIINSKFDPFSSIEKIVEIFCKKNKLKHLSFNSLENYLKLKKKSKSQFFRLLKEIKNIK